MGNECGSVNTSNLSGTENPDGRNFFIAVKVGTNHTKWITDTIITCSRGHEFGPKRFQTATALLLNRNKSFNSFGSVAKQNYGQLSREDRKNYFFLQNFRKVLDEKVSMETTVVDIRNREVNALYVYVLVLKHIHDQTMKSAKRKFPNLVPGQVKWIMIISVRCSYSGQKFLCEAALRAGIQGHRIHLVLESESASSLCRENEIFEGERKFHAGDEYVLAQLGEYKVDFSVHRILSTGELHQLYVAKEDIGGTSVNQKCEEHLKDLVGENMWNRYKVVNPKSYHKVVDGIEVGKQLFFSKTKKMKIRVHKDFIEYVDENRDLSQDSDALQWKWNEIEFSDNKMQISKNRTERFFKPSINEIAEKLREILQEFTNVKTLMLVGGYAGSIYLQQRMHQEFKNLCIFVPQDPKFAVVQGAPLALDSRSFIVKHTSRFIYGLDKLEDSNKDFEEVLNDTEEEDEWADLNIEKFIMKGQVVNQGQIFTVEGFQKTEDSDKMKSKWNAVYRYSCGVNFDTLGYVVRDPPEEGWPNTCEIVQKLTIMKMGFKVKYINLTTGQVDVETFLF